MTVYARPIATAQRLIAKYGQAVDWYCTSEGFTTDDNVVAGADEISPKSIPDVPKGTRIAFFPPDREQEKSLMQNGIEVTKGHVIGYMAQVAFVPSDKDYVLRNGVKLDVEEIEILAPDGNPILYTILFHGADPR